MINGITIEICIGNIDDAITASKYPIDRIELNSAIELGGLTPSIETLKKLKGAISQKICCMVRPRGGDFIYSQNEFETMLLDGKNLLENGADGIVFGFLNEDNTLDEERTKQMIDLAHSYGKEAIFHKAFDEVTDQFETIKKLADLNIDRILTSGKAVYPEIIEGCKVINQLYNQYGDRVQLLPGGGVRIENIQQVVTTTGSGQVHMTSKKQYPGGYLGLDEPQLQQMLQKLSEL